MWMALGRMITRTGGRAARGMFGRSAAARFMIGSRRLGRGLSSAWHGLTSTTRGLYEVGWALESAQRMGENFYPRVTLAVTVKIQGSWWARIADLYRVAVGIASSTRPQLDGLCNQSFLAHIDHTNRIVEVQIAYSLGGLAGRFNQKELLAGLSMLASDPVKDIRASNKWPSFINGLLYDPAVLAPGTLMLTADKGFNPVPAADGLSRSSDLVSIVTAALIDPCKKPVRPNSKIYRPTPSIINVGPTSKKDQTRLVKKLKYVDGKGEPVDQ